jgi:hypothetical protein
MTRREGRLVSLLRPPGSASLRVWRLCLFQPLFGRESAFIPDDGAITRRRYARFLPPSSFVDLG